MNLFILDAALILGFGTNWDRTEGDLGLGLYNNETIYSNDSVCPSGV